MRQTLPLVTLVCCGALACQGVPEGEALSPVTFTLTANDDGDLERCDATGQCESIPNPDHCATLVVRHDAASATTCESCTDDAGNTAYDRCRDTRIACTVVTAPEPDCVVCAHVQGAIVFSTCLPPEDGACRADADCPDGTHCEGSSVCPPEVDCVWEGEPGRCVADEAPACTEDECGPWLRCPVYECWDGSLGGCTNECLRDPETGECGRIRQCPPEPTACTDEECGPPPMCPAYLCWDGSTAGCTGICERGDDGACGYVVATCPPEPRCEDADCGRGPCPTIQCEDGTVTSDCSCEFSKESGACLWTPIDTCGGACATDADCPKGTHCEGSSICPPDLDCFWEGTMGQCVADPLPCSQEECGPPPPCGAPLQCEDGSFAGCACERGPDSGQCGWTYQACSTP